MQNDRQRLRLNELRGISIVGVLMIHISATFLYMSSNELTNIMLLSINQWARFSVPIFFMITGMVLYHNYGEGEINYLAFISKRLRYIIIPYLLWAMIYGYIRTSGIEGIDTQIVKAWIIDTLSGRVSYHLYFIVVLVQLYLIFPLIRSSLMPPYAFWTLLLSVIVYGVLTYSLWIQLQGNVVWPTGYQFIIDHNNIVFWWLLYFVLGTRLSQFWPTWEQFDKGFKKDKRRIVFLGVLVILGAMLVWMVRLAYDAYLNWPAGFSASANFFRMSVLLYTLLFVMMAYLWNRSRWFNRTLEVLGRYSFGMYLSHVFFLKYIGLWVKGLSVSAFNAFVITTILVFTASIIFTVIATRVSLLSWLVGKPQREESPTLA